MYQEKKLHQMSVQASVCLDLLQLSVYVFDMPQLHLLSRTLLPDAQHRSFFQMVSDLRILLQAELYCQDRVLKSLKNLFLLYRSNYFPSLHCFRYSNHCNFHQNDLQKKTLFHPRKIYLQNHCVKSVRVKQHIQIRVTLSEKIKQILSIEKNTSREREDGRREKGESEYLAKIS